MEKQAVVIGATGLTGQALVRQLADTEEYSRVVCPGRRLFEPPSERIVPTKTDLKDSGALGAVVAGDDLYFCFGSTRKQAGGAKAFEQLEKGVTEAVIEASKKGGIKRAMVISAGGTSATSPFHYSRVKAWIEKRFSDAGFEEVYLLRPSLLTGPREEYRFGEKLATWVMSPLGALMKGPLAKGKPMPVETLAACMRKLAESGRGAGVHILENDEIHQIVAG
jgi:uncharacterized protein YbjT (DUF2867 family)